MKRLLFLIAFLLSAGQVWGATYYADTGGSGTTCSQASPCTLTYAVGTKANAGDGHTVIINAGTYGPLAAINVTKAMTVQAATGTRPSMSFNAGAHGFAPSGAGTKTFTGFTITSGGDGTHRTFAIDNSAQTITFNDVWIDGWGGQVIRSAGNTTAIFNRCVFKNNISTAATDISVVSATFTFNYCLFLNSGSNLAGNAGILGTAGTAPSITLNNCILSGNQAGLTGGFAVLNCAVGTLTLNNCTVFQSNQTKGSGTYVFKQSSTGTINVNNSIIHGSAFRALRISTGTVTFTNCQTNVYPHFTGPGTNAIFSFAAIDVVHIRDGRGPGGVGTAIDYYMPAFAAQNAHFSFYPDDTNTFDATQKATAQAFVAAGNDLGAEPRSGSRMNVLDPFYVAYVGAGANPRVVVTYTSDDNASLALITDSGTDNTFQIGHGDTIHFIGDDNPVANTLIDAIDGHADWVAATNYPSQAYYDDLYATTLDNGTYTIVDNTSILLNQARFFQDCIDYSINDIESDIMDNTYTVKSFTWPQTYYTADAVASLKSQGITSAIKSSWTNVDNSYNHLINLPNMYNLDLILGATWLQGTGWADLNAAQKEDRVRNWVRAWAAAALHEGWWSIQTLPWDSVISTDEITWMVSELKTLGVQVLSVAEAADYLAANYTANGDGYTYAYTPFTDFRPLPSSPAINAGVDVGLVTDYEGRNIRGLPDIGAFEAPPNRRNVGVQ